MGIIDRGLVKVTVLPQVCTYMELSLRVVQFNSSDEAQTSVKFRRGGFTGLHGVCRTTARPCGPMIGSTVVDCADMTAICVGEAPD